MDDDGTNDQRQKELSISLAASSMINASEMISEDAYQANLRRIQEVKEMVRKLEMNNESAHKNYVVRQLEQRAKDGREAEVVLAQLRNQSGLPETIQFTNNVSSDKSEVILPTTATLTEVPESRPSSYSSPTPTTTSAPRTTKRGRFVEYQWPEAPPYSPNISPYGAPVYQPPQYGVDPRSQVPPDGQMSWYTTQSASPQSTVHNPVAYSPSFQQTRAQQPFQRPSHPLLVVAPPVAHPMPVTAPGYYTFLPGWTTAAPTHSGSGTSSSSSMHHETSFPTQSVRTRPSVATHKQAQDLPSFAVTSQGQAPLRGIPVPLAKASPAQPFLAQPHQRPPEPQSRLPPVSKPVAMSEVQQLHIPPQQSKTQRHQQQAQFSAQPQTQSQPVQPSPPRPHQQTQPPPHPVPPPPPQLQRQSQPGQAQPQGLLPLQSPQSLQQSQELSTLLRVPAQPTDRVLSTEVSHSEPSQSRDSLSVNTSSGVLQTQPAQPTVVQEQRGAQTRIDQATFIKLFQIAIQRGIPHLKAFCVHAKASGISDEWLRVAINSVSRDVWESVVGQVNQSGSTLDIPSSTNVPQQQATANPGSNSLVVGAQSLPTTTPLAQTLPVPQEMTKPGAAAPGRDPPSAPGQLPESYAAQLKYYAEQATKSALSAQVSSVPATLPGNTSSSQNTVATPIRDALQARVSVRTPKDANKSTLARDILRSLGKIVPKPCQETGGEPMDQTNNDEDNQLPEANVTQPPATSTISPSIPLGKSDLQIEPQGVSPSDQPTAKSILKDEPGNTAVVEGPIMIDLTLEDSDESADGQEPELSVPIQTSATAATSSQPVSPTNTEDHTPLLENLSLEESRVDATNGDATDVRMCSPPLSFTTEENAGSGLLYPQLGSAEPASSNFEPLPREASEHHMNGRLPLFLPSPTLSPAHTEPPETDPEMTNDEGRDSPFLKRRSVDVDEMETDTALLASRHVKKRRKQQVYVLLPPAPPYVKKAIKKMKERAMGKDISSDVEGVGEDEEIQYSHLEQLLIEESKPRLLERRCRWLNCGAILNCAANLFAHLKNHAREEDSQPSFPCRWGGCRRQFDTEEERDVHLESHTIRPLPCPFAGCDEQFNKPVEVMQHEVHHQRVEHREPLMHKPAYQPIVPAIPARLGPPPQRLPSHRVMPRRVVKCRISAERHAAMGPWILWNIFSPVDLSTRKQDASMRGRLTRPAYEQDVNSNPRRDDYDFLLALSSYSAKNPQPDDLDSTLITMSAARGLTLWGSGSAVNSATPGTPEEYPNAGAAEPTSAAEDAEETWVEEGSEVGEAASAENSLPEERQSRQSVVTGEEDAVERMLIA